MTPTLVLVAMLAQAPAPAPSSAAPPAPTPAPAPAQPVAPDTAAIGRGYYLYLRGLDAQQGNDLAGAIGNYRDAIRLLPGAAEIHAQLAQVYAGQNQLTEAAEQARAALAADPADPESNRLLGWIEYLMLDTATPATRQRLLDSAIGHLEVAASDRAGDPRAGLWLSDLYIQAGRQEKAISQLQVFLADRPGFPEAMRMLAQAYELNGQPGEAEEVMEMLAASPPDLFELRVRAIGRLERAGRWRDAVAGWADLIGQDSTGALYRTRYAAALANAGDVDRARDVLTEAIGDVPKNIPAYYLLALVEARAGNAAASDAAVARIRAIDPNDARAPLAVAHARAARKDYDGVVKALESRVESPLATDISTGYYTEMVQTLSAAYEQLGKRKRVTAVLETAHKHDAGNQRLLFLLASAYDQDGRRDRAETALRTLIAANADHAEALNYLGYMFAEDGRNLPEAVDLINRALAIDRDNPAFLDSLGWAYFKMGDVEKARQPLERAASALPDVSVIQDHLGDLYLQMQRYKDAEAAYDRALNGDLDGVDKTTLTRKRDRARALAGRS